MKHTAYIELNEDLVKEYYSDNEYKQYKGYRLLAIDGSRIQLPNYTANINEFGLAVNKGKTSPMATNSTAYDVLNHIAVNTYLDMYSASERTLAEKHLEKIRELTPAIKDITLVDRGYPSLYLFTKMINMGYEFVARCNDKGFLEEVKEFAKSDDTDSLIQIDLHSGNRQNYATVKRIESSQNTLTLRVVKIKLSTGTTEYLITSLLDKETFTIEDLKELYHLRWGEETYFNFQKNVLEIENFSGKNPESVRQDYFARVLSSNLSSLLIEDAQDEVNKKEDQEKKYEYQINKSVAYGIMKDEVIEMLLAPESTWETIYNKLVNTIKRFTVPRIPDRHFERKPRPMNKFFLKKRKVI